MIHDMKFDKNIFIVNQIQNHNQARNIHISTHSIERVIAAHIAKIVIFEVLDKTPISSSLFSHSQWVSKYEVSLDDAIFEIKNVKTTTIVAKIMFNSKSVEKKLVIILTFCCDLSNSFWATAKTFDTPKKIKKLKIIIFSYIKKDIVKIILIYFNIYLFIVQKSYLINLKLYVSETKVHFKWVKHLTTLLCQWFVSVA